MTDTFLFPPTEDELKARAVAPRVTPQDLDDNIASIHYINAGEAAAYVEKRLWVGERSGADLLTICVIVLKNGFTVTGESACAAAENYQKDIGERIALANAKEKIWPLMGYALKERLREAAEPVDSYGVPLSKLYRDEG